MLLVLALLVAVVVEFSYDVYTTTSSLYNWSEGRRLSQLADSGIEVAQGLLKEAIGSRGYTYPERVLIPVPLLDTDDALTVEIIDEQSRFNINSIIYANGNDNVRALRTLQRLLRLNGRDENLVYYIADWIDPDSEPRRAGSEAGAKNAPMYTTAELRYVKGVDEETFRAIEPYVTVFGDSGGRININTADETLIMALSDRIDETVAGNVITYRERAPFERPGDLARVPGFSDIVAEVSGMYVTKSGFYRIRATASVRGITRTAEAVIDMTTSKVLYYRDY